MIKNSKVLVKLQKKELIFLGGKIASTLSKFVVENGIRIAESGTLKKREVTCCNNEYHSFIYSYLGKDKNSFGKMKICCPTSLEKEMSRITSVIKRPRKTYEEIYIFSYKGIRGSVGHIIFQAFLGKNEWKYIRESNHVKEESVLRNIKRIVAPCNPKDWDQAINDFSKDPTQEKIEEIIKLYSPLYRDDIKIVKKMAEQVWSYLPNLPNEWSKEEIRIVDTHVGVCDLVVGDKLIEFKFSERKIGVRKNDFEQLYRYYRSACELNPEEKNKIKYFVVFSPITKEIHQLTVDEADKKWNLEEYYNQDFREWQKDNMISIGRVGRNIVEGRVKVINFEEEIKILIE